jgi:hypothetical protein
MGGHRDRFAPISGHTRLPDPGQARFPDAVPDLHPAAAMVRLIFPVIMNTTVVHPYECTPAIRRQRICSEVPGGSTRSVRRCAGPRCMRQFLLSRVQDSWNETEERRRPLDHCGFCCALLLDAQCAHCPADCGALPHRIRTVPAHRQARAMTLRGTHHPGISCAPGRKGEGCRLPTTGREETPFTPSTPEILQIPSFRSVLRGAERPECPGRVRSRRNSRQQHPYHRTAGYSQYKKTYIKLVSLK